jgi:ATP-dependent Lon protease
MIKERKEREERQTKILNTMKAVQKSSRTHILNEQLKLIEKESILSKKRPLEKLQDSETDIVMDMLDIDAK